MGLIEDLWFNALNDLEDIDIPANTTTFTDYATTQWIVGVLIKDQAKLLIVCFYIVV
jgi:hypothetical protein